MFMLILTIIIGLVPALVPMLLWLIAKPVMMLLHKPLPFVGFGYSALGIAILLWSLLAYGYFLGRWRLAINEIEYAHHDIPTIFDGFKIVHISDLHLSTFDDKPEQLARIVNEINAQNPDLICFTGDMVTLGTKEALPYTEMLKSLKAEYGVASVMGNHDFLIYGNRFGSDTTAHKNAVEEFARYQIETLGWHLLRNSNMIIKAENEKIKNTIDNTVTILGVDNKSCTNQGFRSTNTGDLKAAMRGTQGFRILLSHDPTHWAAEVVPDTDIPLTLSGHTHCAQINILGFTPASWAFEHTRGLYTQEGQTLYINIGLGCTAPFRIGARPEITVITLKSQQSQLHPQQTDL